MKFRVSSRSEEERDYLCPAPVHERSTPYSRQQKGLSRVLTKLNPCRMREQRYPFVWKSMHVEIRLIRRRCSLIGFVQEDDVLAGYEYETIS